MLLGRRGCKQGLVGAADTVHVCSWMDLSVSSQCGPTLTPAELIMNFSKKQVYCLLLISFFLLVSLSSKSVLSRL